MKLIFLEGTNVVFRLLKKKINFILFTIVNIRPLSRSLSIIVLKFVQLIFGYSPKNISFLIKLNHKNHSFTVDDMTQFTYLCNMFHSNRYMVSAKINADPIIIDAGANIGAASLYFLSKYPNATIFAFDASLSNVTRYKNNFVDYPQVHIEHKAVWNSDTTLKFNYSSVSRFHSANKIDNVESVQDVEAIRLDHWLQQKGLRKIDILKFNVEGAELKAVNGLGDEIQRIGVIVGEFHPDQVRKQDFIEELGRRNFEVIRYEKAGKNVFTFEAVSCKVA